MWRLIDNLSGQAFNGFGSDFGRSIACNFNGTTLVVGGATDSEGLQFAGAAWIYTGNGINWNLKQKITGSQVNGRLSRHSMNKNGDIIVLGAFGYDNFTGAALIYTGNAINGWSLKQELKPGNLVTNSAWFGRTTKISDNGRVIVIGAQNDNAPGLLAGSLTVYTGDGNNWAFAQKLTGQRPSGGMNRGSLNNDGSIILAGGYPYASSSDPQNIPDPKPFAIIYTGNPQLGRWVEKQRFSGTNSTQLFKDCYGISTDMSEDGNTFVIGAAWEDFDSRNVFADTQGFTYRGAIYIYTGNPNNGWALEYKAIGPFSTASFGWNVAISRDGKTVVAGSPSFHPWWTIGNNPWCQQGDQNACNENNLSYASVYQKNIVNPTINNPGGWALVSNTTPDYNQSEFGTYNDLSDNGDIIFVGGPRNNVVGLPTNTSNGYGLTQIFKKVIGTWIRILNVGRNICNPPSSSCLKITNVGTNICSNFIPTGTPYNFNSNQVFNFQGITGILYTGWNLASINPSDDNLSVRLSSGSYVVVTINQPFGGGATTTWEAIPNINDFSNKVSFNLFNGNTPFIEHNSESNTVTSFSGFLPREYNRLTIRRIGGGGPTPSVTISGNFGFFAPTPNCLKINNVR